MGKQRSAVYIPQGAMTLLRLIRQYARSGLNSTNAAELACLEKGWTMDINLVARIRRVIQHEKQKNVT